MKKNVGRIDQIVRIPAGIILIVLAATGTVGWWAYLIALVPLSTGLFGWCPIYSAAHVSTAKERNTPDDSSEQEKS